MKSKREAFTMIELVFVIVILGILASVAIPKLTATRDDAEAVASVVEVNNIITGVGTYYTAHGIFSKISDMTNEKLVDVSFNDYDGDLTTLSYFSNDAKTAKCLSFQVDDSNGSLIVKSENSSKGLCIAMNKLLEKSIKVHNFGGSRIYN